MEKANFTRPLVWMNSLGRAALTIVAILGLVNFSYAQGCNVGCNDDINVTLKSDCSAPVTPDMLLEGYECVLLSYGGTSVTAADFIIDIIDADESKPELNGKGKFIYEIKLKSSVQSGLSSSHPLKQWPGCWGYITGEDKIDPVVTCPSPATTLDLICTDIDDVLNKKGITGIYDATATDNCGTPALTFKDVVSADGDCGLVTITRTWKTTDGVGRTDECTQTISFRKPTLHDVYKPTTEVHVDCGFEDALLEADEDLTIEDLITADGHPTPLALELLDDGDGFPSITTHFDTHLFGDAPYADSYCNIGASYDDISEIDICTNTVKIVRQWTIINWCYVPGQDALNNSPLINHRQIIKYGDFTAPEIEDLSEEATITVGTGAFDCTAPYTIPGVDVEDACSPGTEKVSVKVYKTTSVERVDRYGNGTGVYDDVTVEVTGKKVGDRLNLELGATYTIKYRATDGCGNESGEEVRTVKAEDDTAPVAVCDDDLHVSVGGNGIGRVTDRDLDEGSWDNCGKPQTWISRKLATDVVRDAYLDQVEDLTFDDLVATTLEDWDNDSDAVIWVEDANGNNKWDSATEQRRVLRQKDGMLYTWWDKEEWFLCDDVTEVKGDDVVLELLAMDREGNTNVCWNSIWVEDKIRPTCTVANPDPIVCTELPYGFDPENNDDVSALPGVAAPVGADNCAFEVKLRSISADWECNSGTITRTFYVVDEHGLESIADCKQTITVTREHNYMMTFPKDPAKALGCTEAGEGGIGEDIDGCDLLSVNIKEETFTASGDACYKIKRTYKVINWCEYDGESAAVEIRRNEDNDSETGEHDVYVRRDKDGKAYIDDDNDPKKDPLRVVAAADVTGYWTYIQYIKIQDEVPPVITNTSDTLDFFVYAADCLAPVDFSFSVSDDCTTAPDKVAAFVLPDGVAADKIAVTVAGSYPDYTIGVTSALRLPIGNHVLEIHVLDGCRNSAILKVPFRVIDAKVPAPICINGLAVELMRMEDGTGAMVIWASDFEVSTPGEDCTPDITLSINRVGETASRTSTSLTLTCADLDTVAVEIYAWDSANNPHSVQPDGTVGGANYDHCVTYVVVQDNMFDLCEDPGKIGVAGLITNEENETVENVQVNLTGGTALNTTTTVNGSFNFSGLTPGNDYTITPVKDNDYLNGVSTFDLVLITKHILGSKKLDSPYKLIAADANNSGSVSAVDLIQFRKLILSINRDLSSNTSWRFIPASYQFPDPNNPWAAQFPEILNYNDLQTAIATGDFVAIKLGDVNGSARANSAVNSPRTIAGVFNLNVQDQQVVAGNEYRVAFTAADLNVQGYQFTMNLKGLDLVDIEYGVAKAENFGLIEDGVITTSWNGTAAGSELFTLVVRSNTNAQLSELLSINSRYTVAEAYNTADEQLDVALTFNGQAVANAGFELYQNTPNPFQGQTMIGFTLPEAAQATIKIHDVTGKALKMIRGEYAKGYNQINLNSSELPAVGVLYYTLETDEFTSTKKMVVLGE